MAISRASFICSVVNFSFPVNFGSSGILVEAERIRASTAALIVGIATPRSSAAIVVHLPVPFWPALSLMRSIRL